MLVVERFELKRNWAAMSPPANTTDEITVTAVDVAARPVTAATPRAMTGGI